MTSDVRFPAVTVQLTGRDGNAFYILGTVTRALRRAGATEAEVSEYMGAAMAGDYDNLLATTMAWVEVE